MTDPVLERTTEATWPEQQRLTAWAFQIAEQRWSRAWSRLDELYMVREGGVPRASLALYLPKLVVLGRAVPVGSYAAVAVAPDARGAGLASGMMRTSLRALRARGLPLASLYASSQALYRGVGFELAGHRIVYRTPARELRLRAPAMAVREIDEVEVLRRWRPRHAHLERTPGLWNRLFSPNEGVSRAYAVGDEGYVILGHEADNDVVHLGDMQLHGAEAHQRAWALCASMATMADHISWVGGPDDPMLAALPEHGRARVAEWHRWMLRILDVPGALMARGWAADGTLDIDLTDPLFPENEGRWRIVVEGGRAEVTRGGTGALALDVRGLASLYTGFTTPEALSTWARCEGAPEVLAAAQRLFCAPTPWMPDFY